MKIRIFEGLLICTIYSLVLKVGATLFEKLAYWGDIFLIVGWILILTFVLLKSKGRILAFKTTGRILSFLHLNNPDFFRDINETALKKHIKKKISNTPFKEIINKISLYEANVSDLKYQLVVEAPNNHIGFKNIVQNWDIDNPLGNDFHEIYKTKPEDNYKEKWACSVVNINEKLSDTFVVKQYSWILYKK